MRLDTQRPIGGVSGRRQRVSVAWLPRPVNSAPESVWAYFSWRPARHAPTLGLNKIGTVAGARP